MNLVADEKNLTPDGFESLIDRSEGDVEIRQDLTLGDRFEFRAEMMIKLKEAHQQCQMAPPSKGQSETGIGNPDCS